MHIHQTSSSSLLLLLILATTTTTFVSSHGIVTEPYPHVVSDPDGGETNYVATILGGEILPGYAPYTEGDPAGTFDKYYQASSYESVREIVDEAYDPSACGNTDPTGPAIDVSSLDGFKFQNTGNTAEGFTPSHKGPCEVWLGNTKVFWDADCASTYTTSPAEVPMSYEECGDSCMMRIYWLALHNEDSNNGGIQVYKNCVPIATTADAVGTTVVEEETGDTTTDIEEESEEESVSEASSASSSSSSSASSSSSSSSSDSAATASTSVSVLLATVPLLLLVIFE